jgi:hypothetical protein
MSMNASCKWCKKMIVRRGARPPVFCSLACKGAWQKTTKPLSREQLYDLYVEKGLSTYLIAKRVRRNPKRVYEWLVGYGIQPRPRGWSTAADTQPFHKKSWLEREYVGNLRSAKDIADEFEVTENNVLFFLRKLGISTRSMEEIRAKKYWGSFGSDNPMYGRRGQHNPHWKGGVTPQRQAFYLSREWRVVSQKVWKRDRAMCQRCGLKKARGVQMHIHHKVSFACVPLRARLSNLVLLCEPCHDWVHSRKNQSREWIEQEPRSISAGD